MKDKVNFLEILKEMKFQERINELSRKYKSKKIAIYGAGTLSSIILNNFDLSGLNISAIIDLRYFIEDDNPQFMGYKAISPYEIKKSEIDIIFIANFNSDNITKFLQEDIFQKTREIPVISFVNFDNT